MPATVWQILNMNCMQRKWCEFAETSLKKFVKSIQANLFSADFSHSEPLSVSAEWSPKILEKRRWVRVVKNLSATSSCISPSFDLVTNIVAWFVLPKAAFSAQEYKNQAAMHPPKVVVSWATAICVVLASKFYQSFIFMQLAFLAFAWLFWNFPSLLYELFTVGCISNQKI